MHSPTGRNLPGFFHSLNAALLWGILPIALKEIIVTMDAFTIVWYRFLFSGLVLGIFLLARRQLPRPAPGKLAILLLVVAGLSLCINYLLFSLSLNYLNAESSEAVIQLTSLFLLLGGVVIYREPFALLQKTGTACILLGLLLFFNDRWGELFDTTTGMGFGVLLVVLAALTWVVYALLQKHLLRSFSAVQVLFSVYLLSILVLMPLVSPADLLALSPLQLGLLGFCCLNTVLAYGSFAEALVHWHASKVSAVLALAPLFTIAALKVVVWVDPDYVFTDHLNLLSVLAAFVLVAGSVLVALMPLLQRPRRSPAR